MPHLSLIIAVVNIFNRLLGYLNEYQVKQKQSKRDTRREAVREQPTESFEDMFGEPINEQLRNSTIEQQHPRKDVRANLPTTNVDKNS